MDPVQQTLDDLVAAIHHQNFVAEDVFRIIDRLNGTARTMTKVEERGLATMNRNRQEELITAKFSEVKGELKEQIGQIEDRIGKVEAKLDRVISGLEAITEVLHGA